MKKFFRQSSQVASVQQLSKEIRVARILRQFWFLLLAAGLIIATGILILSLLNFSLDKTSTVVLDGSEFSNQDLFEERSISSWDIAMSYAPGYLSFVAIITAGSAIILLFWFWLGVAKFLRKIARFLRKKVSPDWLADFLVLFGIFVFSILVIWFAAAPEFFLAYVARVIFILILATLILLIFSQLAGRDFAQITEE